MSRILPLDAIGSYLVSQFGYERNEEFDRSEKQDRDDKSDKNEKSERIPASTNRS
jgi:hypothetical protein